MVLPGQFMPVGSGLRECSNKHSISMICTADSNNYSPNAKSKEHLFSKSSQPGFRQDGEVQNFAKKEKDTTPRHVQMKPDIPPFSVKALHDARKHLAQTHRLNVTTSSVVPDQNFIANLEDVVSLNILLRILIEYVFLALALYFVTNGFIFSHF